MILLRAPYETDEQYHWRVVLHIFPGANGEGDLETLKTWYFLVLDMAKEMNTTQFSISISAEVQF